MKLYLAKVDIISGSVEHIELNDVKSEFPSPTLVQFQVSPQLLRNSYKKSSIQFLYYFIVSVAYVDTQAPQYFLSCAFVSRRYFPSSSKFERLKEVSTVAPCKRPNPGSSEVDDHVKKHKKNTANDAPLLEELYQINQTLKKLQTRQEEILQELLAKRSQNQEVQTIRAKMNGLLKPHVLVFAAFRSGNYKIGTELIENAENCFDINQVNSMGYTLLHVAVKHGVYDGVVWCLMVKEKRKRKRNKF
jgi:hypothetical protein